MIPTPLHQTTPQSSLEPGTLSFSNKNETSNIENEDDFLKIFLRSQTIILQTNNQKIPIEETEPFVPQFIFGLSKGSDYKKKTNKRISKLKKQPQTQQGDDQCLNQIRFCEKASEISEPILHPSFKKDNLFEL
ncbi:hypothetical protein M0813_28160 [Anaeramoeba flamelloides]|uniref:Uncharacterized protein n=1 Tax=Anaeramoeba flamelloides TaxID=1746091 RepID=A0AAV7ZWJ3_9EUKA|nr:hypothetical protein M0812_10733 [Anaeramoeba flamelloides]KAJ6236127.1 hypothetical protein M0813_28160 [Anaeramoeba flamelloides]